MLRVARIYLLGIRFTVPWIVRAFGFTLKLIATTVVALWIRVPTMVRKIADDCLDTAVDAGFPTRYDRYLYYAVCVTALLTIIAGWIVLAYLTVWFIGVIL